MTGGKGACPKHFTVRRAQSAQPDNGAGSHVWNFQIEDIKAGWWLNVSKFYSQHFSSMIVAGMKSPSWQLPKTGIFGVSWKLLKCRDWAGIQWNIHPSEVSWSDWPGFYSLLNELPGSIYLGKMLETDFFNSSSISAFAKTQRCKWLGHLSGQNLSYDSHVGKGNELGAFQIGEFDAANIIYRHILIITIYIVLFACVCMHK